MRILFQSVGILAHYNWGLPFYLLKERNGLKIDIICSVYSFLMGGYYYYSKSGNRLGIKFSNTGVSLTDNLMGNFSLSSKCIKKEKYDIIHINALGDSFTKSLLSSKPSKIFTFHGSLDIVSPTINCELQKIFFKVDVSVAVSNYSAKTIQQVYEIKPVVIHHGVDLSIFNPGIVTRNVARRKLGLHPNKKIILWNARMSPEKRIETLILALPNIVKNYNDALLVIKSRAINRDYWLKIESYIKKLNLKKYIKLDLSWTPFPKMSFYYKAADVFVNTSTTEAFGSLAMLEAMACGFPVIGNDASSIPEAIGNSGLLYDGTSKDLAEKVLEIVSNDRLSNELSNKAYKRVQENFSLNTTARKYLYLYQRL